LRRTFGDEVELLAITDWESKEAIRRFAGEDCEVAVVTPRYGVVDTEQQD